MIRLFFSLVVQTGLILFFTQIVSAQEATVAVTLTPAGDFSGTSTEVKGFATTKDGKKYTAKNIVVNLKEIKTGKDLRDEHTRKYLDVTTYPEAILISATGENGKGTGRVKIKGIEHDISGTYTINDNKLNAKFDILLSDYKISGIRYMGIGVKDKAAIQVSVPIKKSEFAAPAPAAPAAPASPTSPTAPAAPSAPTSPAPVKPDAKISPKKGK